MTSPIPLHVCSCKYICLRLRNSAEVLPSVVCTPFLFLLHFHSSLRDCFKGYTLLTSSPIILPSFPDYHSLFPSLFPSPKAVNAHLLINISYSALSVRVLPLGKMYWENYPLGLEIVLTSKPCGPRHIVQTMKSRPGYGWPQILMTVLAYTL